MSGDRPSGGDGDVGSHGDESIDPVTLEVLNNRLHEISREAGATLTRTAASPVTAESKDLGFNVTTPDGENVVFSTWMPRHGTTLAHMVRSSLDSFGVEDLQAGDQILTNDPHAGALHIMDLAVLAPVFHDGELVAWVGNATHHRDVGAMTTGWPTRATDWYQEGVKYPPIKVMDGGEMREDVFELFLRNVRIPQYQALDLKAQIAANNVARERLLDTVSEYGLDTLFSCYDEMIDYGEATARERFDALPDGEYHYVDYLDYDDLYRLECTLTVEGDTVTFDFTGTADQAPSFINCAFPCAEANIHNILLVTMFQDTTVNAGTFRPVTVDIPEGTVFNCTPPAPCGGASIYAGRRIASLANTVLSEAFADSEDPSRASAEWGGGSPSLQVTGEDRGGEEFTMFVMDQSMLGGGARYDKDGEHTTNILASTNTSIPNVEYYEERFPLLYLRRGLRQDSGGAGRHRGGLSGEFAFTVRGEASLTVNPFQHRTDTMPYGLFGGYPGTSGFITRKANDPDAPLDVEAGLDDATPEEVYAQQNEEFELTSDSLLHVGCAAGGAIGDPFERDVDRLAADLREGRISPEEASAEYGAVVDDGEVQAESTEAARRERRRDHLADLAADEASASGDEPCPTCGTALLERTRRANETRKFADVRDDRILLQERFCDECATLADVRVLAEGDDW